MIDYDAGEMIDLLPPSISNDSDVRAISYALKKGKDKLLEYCEYIKLMSNIDKLPEELIDLLSLELNSHYYDQEMDLEQKRSIVKATLGWYMQAGTVAAVNEMMQIIFGNGNVVEWYEFEDGAGKPGTFDVFTDTVLTPELIERVLMILKRVKKASAHLRRLRLRRDYESMIAFAGTVVTKAINTFYSEHQEVNEMDFEMALLAAMSQRIRNVMKGGE